MILCSCANINDRKVREALAAGARTLADVQVELGVAMGCGRCRDAVTDEIARHFATGAAEEKGRGCNIPQTA